jgi:hypothetical protein
MVQIVMVQIVLQADRGRLYDLYYFAGRVSYAFLNVFAIKMAGVFTFSTRTIALRTAIFPR